MLEMSMTPSCLNYADMENAVKKLLAATLVASFCSLISFVFVMCCETVVRSYQIWSLCGFT